MPSSNHSSSRGQTGDDNGSGAVRSNSDNGPLSPTSESKPTSSRSKLLALSKRASTGTTPSPASASASATPLSTPPLGLNQNESVAIRVKDSIIKKLRVELSRSIPTTQFKKAVDLFQQKIQQAESEIESLKKENELLLQQSVAQQQQSLQQPTPQREQQQSQQQLPTPQQSNKKTNVGSNQGETKQEDGEENLEAEYPAMFQNKDLELKKLRHDLKQKDVLVSSLRNEIDTIQQQFHQLQQQLQQEVQQHREATKRQLLQQKKDRSASSNNSDSNTNNSKYKDDSQGSYAETSDFDEDDEDYTNTSADGDPALLLPVPSSNKKKSKMLSPVGSRRGGVARHSMFEMSESRLQTDGYLDMSKSSEVSAVSSDWMDESKVSNASTSDIIPKKDRRGRKAMRASSSRSLRTPTSSRSPSRSQSPVPQKPKSWGRFDLSSRASTGTSMIKSPKSEKEKKKKKNVFKSTGKAMKKTAQLTGMAVAKGTKATGMAVVKGSKATGNAVVKGGQAVVGTGLAVVDVTKNTGKIVLDAGTGAVVNTTKAVGDATLGAGKAVVGVTLATGTALGGLGSTLLPRSLTGARNPCTQTKWDQAIDLLSDIIEQEPLMRKQSSLVSDEDEKTNDSTGTNTVTFSLTKDQKYDLEHSVKPLLIEGMQLSVSSQQVRDPLVHMPLNLLRNTFQFGTKAVGAGLKPVDVTFKYILSEFGGIAEKTFSRPGGPLAKKFSNEISRGSESTDDSMECDVVKDVYVPPEFDRLSREKKNALFKLLSWSSLKQWNFNIFQLTELCEGHPLVIMGWAILASPHSQFAMAVQCGIDDEINIDDLQGYHFLDHKDLKIPHVTLCKYLRAIEDHYVSTNPYHNEIHAADILQTTHSILQMIQHQKQYQHVNGSRPIFHVTTIEQFTLLLTAVVHDVEHTGKNNAFEVNTQSEVALVYNDISVLENKHASRAFAIMAGQLNGSNSNNAEGGDGGGSNTNSTPGPNIMLPRRRRRSGNQFENGGTSEYNILCNIKPELYQLIRTMVIDAVLHTDMSKHFQTVNEIKALMLSRTGSKGTADLDHDSKWRVLMYLLHCADISGQTKPAPLFQLWTDRVIEEFFEQGDKEAELGLPVSPNCDRNTVKVPHSQVGFVEFVIKPAYELLGTIVTSIEERVVPIIDNNLQYWQNEQQKLDQVSDVGELKRRSQLLETTPLSAGQATSETTNEKLKQ